MPHARHALLVRDCRAGAYVRAGDRLGLGLDDADLAERIWLDWLHPEDRAAAASALDRGCGSVVARHATRDADEWRRLRWTLSTDRGSVFVLGQFLHDDETRAHIDATVEDGADSMSRMLTRMALIVEAKNPGKKCSILLVDPEQNSVTVGAGPSLPRDYNAAVEGLQIGPNVGSCGTAAFWNVPVIVSDIASDPLWRSLRGVAQMAGVACCWSHPVRATDGAVIGAMALYDTVPGSPTAQELAGLEIAAHMVGLAVERLRLESQLHQAAKMEAVGLMAGGVAHDFNNLLAVIIGNADLARTQGTNNGLEEFLDNILVAADNAAGLCRQLLTSAGHGTVRREEVDCNALIRDLVQLVRSSLVEHTQLRVDLDEHALVVADRSQLRQVLLNLITNAAEALGSKPGEVVITTRIAGDTVQISVHDDGSGIEPELRTKIFDPFFTTKAEGRGLGLAAVKGIAEAHGWPITVSSSAESGTTFTMLLARHESSERASSPPTHTPTSIAPTSTPSAQPKRVLVVDDEDSVRSVISRLLQKHDFEVLTARDGREAIEVFRTNRARIDCVLLDFKMPRMNGEDVFRHLHELDSETPVLLTSGFTDSRTVERFRRLGLAGFVDKPVRAHDLLAKVGSCLHARRRGRPATPPDTLGESESSIH